MIELLKLMQENNYLISVAYKKNKIIVKCPKKIFGNLRYEEVEIIIEIKPKQLVVNKTMVIPAETKSLVRPLIFGTIYNLCEQRKYPTNLVSLPKGFNDLKSFLHTKIKKRLSKAEKEEENLFYSKFLEGRNVL